jgi:hypothetical protein
MDTIPINNFAVVSTLRDRIVNVLFVSKTRKPAMLAMGRVLISHITGVALVERRRDGIRYLFESND